MTRKQKNEFQQRLIELGEGDTLPVRVSANQHKYLAGRAMKHGCRIGQYLRVVIDEDIRKAADSTDTRTLSERREACANGRRQKS